MAGPDDTLVRRALGERLAAFPSFGSVEEEALRRWVARGSPRTVRSGQAIFEEGRPMSAVFVVLEGRFKLSRRLEDGHGVVLGFLGPGEVIGIGGLRGGASDLTVEALEPSTCFEISHEALLALFEAEPRLVAELLPPLVERVAECRHCAVEGMYLRVEPRLRRILVRLADSVGRPMADGVLVPVALSRRDLAELAGTSIETAIRIMSRWSREGSVETRDDGFWLSGGFAASETDPRGPRSET